MKRTQFFSFLLAGIIALAPITALADSFSQGVASYKARNYQGALVSFQKALKENPKDPNRVFYMGMAYTHLNRYDDARQAFELVIQMTPPNSDLANKARNNITVLTKDQISVASNSGKAAQIMKTSLARNAKPNYLTHVIPGGKVVHFDSAKMPLKVFIANGNSVPGWNQNLKQVVVSAMSQWQSATRGKVRFVQTYKESEADIVVGWQRNFNDNILGVSPWQTVGDTLIRSDINLATYYPGSQEPIPYTELQAIAVHEMGHAIGMKGHSPYPDDIMFFSKSSRNSHMSSRDINTIGMLYNIDADIKNNVAMSTSASKKYYELFELGVKAQTGNQPAQAMTYYRQALAVGPSMPEAKFNLGALLINEGLKLARANNINGAKNNFNEAVKLYTELNQSSSPPPATADNLAIARQNLAAVSR